MKIEVKINSPEVVKASEGHLLRKSPIEIHFGESPIVIELTEHEARALIGKLQMAITTQKANERR